MGKHTVHTLTENQSGFNIVLDGWEGGKHTVHIIVKTRADLT